MNEDVMWTNEDKKFHKRGRIVDERGCNVLTCPRYGGIMAVEIETERKCLSVRHQRRKFD